MSAEYTPSDALRLLAVGISDDQACGHCKGDCASCTEDASDLLARVARDAAAAALRKYADSLAEVPDYAPTEYDRGRVDQRHMAVEELHSLAAEKESQR